MLRRLATVAPRISPDPFPFPLASSTRRPGRRCRGRALAWLVMAAGTLLPCLAAPAAWGAESTLAGVVRVSAGDALIVETAEGVQIKLRLFGIQAPPLREGRPQGSGKPVGQPFSEEARQALEELVLKKQVRVELYGRDFFFRYARGVVFLGAENVNVHMVRGGLARVDRAAHRVPEALRAALEQAEAEARRERRGLWMFE